MLTYHAGWSALDRTLIDGALSEACPTVVFVVGPGAADPSSSNGLPEPVAVKRVLTVAQVVASRYRPDPVSDRRRELDDLLAQIIDHVAKRRARPKSPLPIFETMVQDALSTCAWWPSPAPAPSAPANPSVSLITLKKAAALLDVSEDTLTRMAKSGKLELVRIGKKAVRVPTSEIRRLRSTPAFTHR